MSDRKRPISQGKSLNIQTILMVRNFFMTLNEALSYVLNDRSAHSQPQHLIVEFGLDLLFPLTISKHGWMEQKPVSFPKARDCKLFYSVTLWSQGDRSCRVYLCAWPDNRSLTPQREARSCQQDDGWHSSFTPSVPSNWENGRIGFPFSLAFDNIYWVAMSAVKQLV